MDVSERARSVRGGTAILVALLLATALALGTAPGAAAQTVSWLDSPPRAFNTPGAAVPAAPPSATPAGDRCRARERPAAGPEETRVAAAGWRLEEYWPTRRAGDLTLVMGNAEYDGMCRDASFNGFVFVGGRFAGTIAPAPMSARTDGVLSDLPTISSDRRVVASFIRYAPSDPLCCPSRGQTRVTYRVDAPAAGPVLVPDQIVQVPPTPTPTPSTATPTPATPTPIARPPATPPTQLPRTGTPPLGPPTITAIALLTAGTLLQRLRVPASPRLRVWQVGWRGRP
jgi:LppP/LprE lipoprotein